MRNPWNFIIPTLKVSVTIVQGFFDLREFNFQTSFHIGCSWNKVMKIRGDRNAISLKLCYTNFKSFSNKSTRIFWFEQLLYNKVDFTASDFEAALQLQIEVKWKMFGRSVTLGPKSVEKHLIKGTLKNLTTPIADQVAENLSKFWKRMVKTPMLFCFKNNDSTFKLASLH